MTKKQHSLCILHNFSLFEANPNVRGHITIPPNNPGRRLLEQQGWCEGTGRGLGKEEQGRLEPVPTVFKNSRVGLGLAEPRSRGSRTTTKKQQRRVTHFPSHEPTASGKPSEAMLMQDALGPRKKHRRHYYNGHKEDAPLMHLSRSERKRRERRDRSNKRALRTEICSSRDEDIPQEYQSLVFGNV
jgi:hypothetical protein